VTSASVVLGAEAVQKRCVMSAQLQLAWLPQQVHTRTLRSSCDYVNMQRGQMLIGMCTFTVFA
jgi:hypothetical protein